MILSCSLAKKFLILLKLIFNYNCLYENSEVEFVIEDFKEYIDIINLFFFEGPDCFVGINMFNQAYCYLNV